MFNILSNVKVNLLKNIGDVVLAKGRRDIVGFYVHVVYLTIPLL